MEKVLGEPLAALPYDQRLRVLERRHVGLWDVFHAAHREGSSDSRIRVATANDLAALTGRFPALEAIAFNGGTAAAEGRRAFRGDLPFALVDLPSSSAANTMRFDAKLDAWRALAPFVG